jgi:hypothetical protein
MDEQRQARYRVTVTAKRGNFTDLNGSGNAVIAAPALWAKTLRGIPARAALAAR